MCRPPTAGAGRERCQSGAERRTVGCAGGGRGRVGDERVTREGVRRLLPDPAVTVVVVERRDRLGRVNTELVEAALSAHNRRLVVHDHSEVTGDLACDMVEVLTWLCAELYGCRSARNRALKALGCAQQDIGPKTVKLQGCGGAG